MQVLSLCEAVLIKCPLGEPIHHCSRVLLSNCELRTFFSAFRRPDGVPTCVWFQKKRFPQQPLSAAPTCMCPQPHALQRCPYAVTTCCPPKDSLSCPQLDVQPLPSRPLHWTERGTRTCHLRVSLQNFDLKAWRSEMPPVVGCCDGWFCVGVASVVSRYPITH